MMWTIFISLCVTSTLIMALAMCLCWRKKQPKNDLLGLDGMVTQKNPDENVNHLPSAVSCVDGVNALPAIPVNTTIDSDDTRRNVPTTNTKRSLPDIPSEQDCAVNWGPPGDNSSEHYATVEQYRNAKRHTLPNGIGNRPSISQHSSMSQPEDSFSPYEKIKYDKIKSKENPYAHVMPSTSRQQPPGAEEPRIGSEERVSLLRLDGAGTSLEPNAPPRSRRSSAHSGLGVDIPAASAVAGAITASPDLPYMTPPVTQSNFSGDSQDSSKGYTSISVREPLANIKAQTKEIVNRNIEKHYSTVSDDSDDVYTTIPDPNNQIYTSESETYAQIPAHPITVEAEVNTPRFSEESDEMYERPPQPPLPSVDSLKQVTGHSHSRQASSSSSIANIGSPKPEKRQANSPLPPPPMTTPGASTSFEFHAEKPHCAKNLDDLYAKVHKNKKKSESPTEAAPEQATFEKSKPPAGGVVGVMPLRKEHNYETLRKNRDTSDPGYEKIMHEEPGYASINGPDSISSSDPGYEVLKQKAPSETDPNYEELRHGGSDNGEASSVSGYSKIKPSSTSEPPGYSSVRKRKRSDDKSRGSSSFGSNSQEYSLDEPNYESMPSESFSSEHNYAALKSGNESDPNYESMSQMDPNYESVRDLEDPPYERLNENSSREELDGYERVSTRGYENIDTSESSNGAGDSVRTKSNPPYEKLSNDTDSDIGYEKIAQKTNHNNNLEGGSSCGELSKEEPKSDNSKSNLGNNCGDLLDENAIFQV